MRIARRAGVSLVSSLVLLPALAATARAGVPVPYPKAATCVDQAAALGTATCARITQVLRADETASGDEIAVAVVQTTGGESIGAWGIGLFKAWGIGGRDRNNGVLLVVAVADHHRYIATGRGLSGRLPGDAASEIAGGTIDPLLKAGRTRDAVLAGLDGIRRALRHAVTGRNALAAAASSPDPAGRPRQPGPASLPLPTPDPEPPSSGNGWLFGLAVLGLIALVGIARYASRMKATRSFPPDLPDRERPWWARRTGFWSAVNLSGDAPRPPPPPDPAGSPVAGEGPGGRPGDGPPGGGSSSGGGSSGGW
ncbi:MAG: uncharacterized protein V7637_2286 [Mycobacteriales bacterium]